tara:strand:- start:763 stop:1440 length:678 start_codon:yes stop_codon:yes gene_type:complete
MLFNQLKIFISSTIGKKIIVATTGLLFCLFLLAHLANNFVIYTGAENFNFLVKSLEKIKPLIRLAELMLVLILGGHIYNSITLAIASKRAKGVSSQSKMVVANASISSRTMVYTGSILFIFLIVHLSTFWYTFQTSGRHDYYFMVTSESFGFGNIIITSLYLIAMIILGFHLRHGFQSAIKTLGIGNTTVGKLLGLLSVIFWLFVPAGFFSIAFWFGIIKHFGLV